MKTCCGDFHFVSPVNSGSTQSAINKKADEMADEVFKEDDDSLIDEGLALLIALALLAEFGKTYLTTVTTTNLTQFAVFKTFWNKKELRQILIKNPSMSFEDFKKEASKINEVYNVTHLKTEFETVNRSAYMVGEWKKIEDKKETHPFLTYKTQEDSRVRRSHQLLNNICRKVDDPFWLSFYPPNDFNCRCFVVQSDEGKETPLDITNLKKLVNKSISKKVISPFFIGNCGKTGIIFNNKHPYFNGINKDTKTHLKFLSSKIQSKI